MLKRRGVRGAVATMLVTALIASGAVLGGSAAYAQEMPAEVIAEAPVGETPAAETPGTETPVAEAPGTEVLSTEAPAVQEAAPAPSAVTATPAVVAAGTEGLTVETSLTNVPAGLGVYVAVIDEGTSLDLTMDNMGLAMEYNRATGNVTSTLQVPAGKLDRAKGYEVVAWQAHTTPSAETIFVVAPISVSDAQWDAVFGAEVVAPSLAAAATGASSAGLTVTATVENIVLRAADQGVYVGIIEKDRVDEYRTDASAGAAQDFAYKMFIRDGAVTRTIEVPAEKLDRSKQYVAVSWLAHGFLDEERFVAQADLEVSGEQWDAVFGAPVPATPQFSVTPNEQLNSAGDSVAVSGSGYDPTKSIYVTTCADIDIAKLTFDYINAGCTSGAKLVWAHGTTGKNGEARTPQFDENGAFALVMDVAPREGAEATALFTLRDHNGRDDRSQDAKMVLNFAAPEVAGPAISASSAVTANEKVDVTVLGTGFEDVKALPGQSVPHVYLALVEAGADLAGVDQGGGTPIATADVESDGKISATLTATTVQLDRKKQYEIISWPSRSNPSEANLYARTSVTIDWDALFPNPDATQVSASIASVQPGEGFNVRVDASNLPIQNGFAYVAVIERGTADSLTQDSTYPGMNPFAVVKAGSLTDRLIAQQSELDRTKQYEVIVWKQHSAATPENIYGRADLSISKAQWDELFAVAPKPKPEPKPDPKPVPPAGGAQQPGSLTWGVSAGFASYATGPIAKGSVTTSGVGGSGGAYVFPQASSSWNAATQTGTVQYSGVVTFSGHKGAMRETFANPVIAIHSATSGTISAGGHSFGLNLGAASKSVGANGEVTWSGVPVAGSISGGGSAGGGTGGGAFAVDPLSFTVGAVNGANYGSTSVDSTAGKKRNAADAPPATSGITMITDPSRIVPGGEIEFEAAGFEPNERDILVVLYSEPTLLDDNAGANKTGTVRWLGTLPEDIAPGEHTLTLQGSTNAGIKITVLEKDAAEKSAKSNNNRVTVSAVNDAEVASAGLLSDTGTPMWVWWAGATFLLILAATTTGLVVAQRRGNQ